MSGIHTLDRFEACDAALRNPNLRQALYDAGAVVMDGVLLTLHGQAHSDRRRLEFRIFKRDFFRYYETQVFPPTLEETLAPFLRDGGCDLVDFGYRVTINLTADFAGIDRPRRDAAETTSLLALVKTFSEGATMVHSTRPKAEVEAEVEAALQRFDGEFLGPSIARRQALLADFNAGRISEEQLPRDILTVLLRNEDKLDLPHALLRREIAFYLQAGSHSTANSMVHALHNLWTWVTDHPEDADRLTADPLFLQRAVHESLRLFPASPEAWRAAVCPVTLSTGAAVTPDDRVVLDLARANRQTDLFGADADRFNPHRPLGKMASLPYGLTFGIGVHTCLGRELDGGLVAKPDTDPATHQYGIVTLLVRRLLEAGAAPMADDPATRDPKTTRPNWGRYPVRFGTKD
jgi:cytochrome P450